MEQLAAAPPASGSPGWGRARPARRSLRWLAWILGAALLGAVIVGGLHFAEAQEFARLAEEAEPWWFLLAVVLQVGTYVGAGQVLRRVIRAGGHSLSLLDACRVGLIKLFVDQAVPTAGLSGTVALKREFERRGIPRPVVAAGIVVDLASYYAAFVFSLALALVFAAIRGEASEIIVLVSLVFILFGIGLSVVVLALSGKTTAVLPRPLVRLRPLRTAVGFLGQADPRLARSPRLLLQASGYQLGVFFCDAATLWALIRSLGAHGSAGGVFASFMISSLLRNFGILPGGLGTFEAASVVTLHLVGVPTAVALAATLLFRGLSFWLPMLPGLWLSRRSMARTAAQPR